MIARNFVVLMQQIEEEHRARDYEGSRRRLAAAALGPAGPLRNLA